MAILYKFKHTGTFMGRDEYTDDFEVDSLGPMVWRRMANGIDTTLHGTDVAAATEILRLDNRERKLREAIGFLLREVQRHPEYHDALHVAAGLLRSLLKEE